MELREGEFVRVSDSQLGLGKLLRLSDTIAEVSYFASPARGEAHRELVHPTLVQTVTLSAQTRVHWFDEGRGGWLVGRIAEDGRVEGHLFGYDEDLYFVELPNNNWARVPISALQVRWEHPVDDPVAYLAARTTETPFWHQGRREFLRHVVEQRAHCASLTGLWSAAVDLQLHQYRTVRTVLTDAVQRYLLADEVGLGKTIEAGAILRQYVLDEPNGHRALVVVPPHLVGQWSCELSNRFYLGDYLGQSIRIASSADPAIVSSAPDNLGMLIVDEAHQPASMAFSPDTELRNRFTALAALARRTPRVLLLSATPVLHNEDGFLAMLHLLEPAAYPLDDRKAFRQRVVNRQQIAESLSDLEPDAVSFFVEEALDRLEPLAKGDAQVGRLIARVREVIDIDEDDPERQVALRDLREHVGEVYRLHRRLIRHRRETLTDVLRGRCGAKVVRVDDPVRRRLGELLEQWRVQASLGGAAGTKACGLHWLLLQAAFSHPMVFRELVRARRHRREPRPDLTPSAGAPLDTLHIAEMFPEESELLDAMLEVKGADGFPRLDAIVRIVREGSGRRLKTVLFADAPGVADRLATALRDPLADRVLRHAPGLSLAPFLDVDGPVVALVCDRQAEEGLNLQEVPAQALHLDLPLDPGRLEQRIGRIDRFGARVQALSVLLVDDDPMAEVWRQCLQDAVQVFDRSVASLQYTLEDHLRWLRDAVFTGGVEAIDDLIGRLQDGEKGLEAEFRKIRTQEQLDSMAAASEAEAEQFETLEDFDADYEPFREGFESWAVDRLQFWREDSGPGRGVVRYRYNLGGKRRTLLSPEQFVRFCSPGVDTEAGPRNRSTHRLSFSRSQALRKHAHLARLGHPFVDGLVEHARRDDRGVAYAMWRQRPGLELPADPWLALGFDFLIEADPDAATMPDAIAARTRTAAFRRYLDFVLPPRYATVWIDQELEPIEDSDVLSTLEEPYDDRRDGGGSDWNLSAERWQVVRPVVQVGAWDELCIAAAERALAHMKTRLGLEEEINLAQSRIEKRLGRVRVQLSARLSRLSSHGAASDRAALEVEETMAEGARCAVRAARVTPDSVFALFLSASHPFGTRGR